MTIRPYEKATDREALRRCVIELQDFERGLDAWLPAGADIAEAYLDDLAAKCRVHHGEIFVAEDEGAVVGYACVWARTPTDAMDDGPPEYAFVKDLVVLPDHRRRGIGRRLLERSQAYARDHGATCLRITALAANATAIELYRSLGFVGRQVQLEKRLA